MSMSISLSGVRVCVLAIGLATAIVATGCRDRAGGPANRAHGAHQGSRPLAGRARADIPAPPDVAAPPPDAPRTPGGVSYAMRRPGRPGGRRPRASDTVRVHYTGWTSDGTMFDSSVGRGPPSVFPLGAVIPGWSEGLQVMTEGAAARFWIPEPLAYRGRPGAPRGTLVFDVELLEVLPSDPAPDVTARAR
jgi:peptidylprolyl isomerase